MTRIKTVGAGVVALFALAFAAVSYAAAVDYFNQKGERVKAEVRGNQFILIGLRGNPEKPADGIYKTLDGKSIIVQGGLIVQGGMPNPGAAKGFNPQPDPPGNNKNKFLSPGATKGFNPQPEPPGDKSKGIVGPTDLQGKQFGK